MDKVTDFHILDCIVIRNRCFCLLVTKTNNWDLWWYSRWMLCFCELSLLRLFLLLCVKFCFILNLIIKPPDDKFTWNKYLMSSIATLHFPAQSLTTRQVKPERNLIIIWCKYIEPTHSLPLECTTHKHTFIQQTKTMDHKWKQYETIILLD